MADDAGDEGPALELDIPEGVSEAEQAVELIRAWVADGTLLVGLNSDAFGDRLSEWGRLLGQIAHHIGRASALQGHGSEHEALQAIRQGFEAMLPTHEPTLSGGIRGRTSH